MSETNEQPDGRWAQASMPIDPWEQQLLLARRTIERMMLRAYSLPPEYMRASNYDIAKAQYAAFTRQKRQP